jgi:hypothetical protein
VRPFRTSASLYNSISTGLPHLPHHRTSLAPHPSRPYRGRTISARTSPGSFPARCTLRSQSGTIAGVSFDTSIECLTPHACRCRLGSPNLPLTYRPLREGAALNLTPRWTEPEPTIVLGVQVVKCMTSSDLRRPQLSPGINFGIIQIISPDRGALKGYRAGARRPRPLLSVQYHLKISIFRVRPPVLRWRSPNIIFS